MLSRCHAGSHPRSARAPAWRQPPAPGRLPPLRRRPAPAPSAPRTAGSAEGGRRRPDRLPLQAPEAQLSCATAGWGAVPETHSRRCSACRSTHGKGSPRGANNGLHNACHRTAAKLASPERAPLQAVRQSAALADQPNHVGGAAIALCPAVGSTVCSWQRCCGSDVNDLQASC